MKKIETGGPAFPSERYSTAKMAGMTLRDYIATKVVVSLLESNSDSHILCVEQSYEIADAMLKARK